VTVGTGGGGTNRPPVAAFDWSPKPAIATKATNFDASASSDRDGTIVKWVWEYGDGVKDASSGKTANHKYAAPGSYDVTLWITDNGGMTVSITKRVTVQ